MNPTATREEKIQIPADMLIDILVIIVRHSLKHQLTEVITSRSLVLLTLLSENNNPVNQKAIRQICDMLTEYNEYRHSESENVNWKDY